MHWENFTSASSPSPPFGLVLLLALGDPPAEATPGSSSAEPQPLIDRASNPTATTPVQTRMVVPSPRPVERRPLLSIAVVTASSGRFRKS
jgi:hypothetical protein